MCFFLVLDFYFLRSEQGMLRDRHRQQQLRIKANGWGVSEKDVREEGGGEGRMEYMRGAQQLGPP